MRDALVRRLWYGDGYAAITARAILTPFEWMYGVASVVTGAWRARDAGRSAVPTVSVGNITVGGTGKTPLAAWVAAQLVRRGRSPALLIRGYGADEPLVHARLNPRVPVFVNPDRRTAAAAAVSQGANTLVLDDAFQHRQMPRDADVVVVSSDLWCDAPPRLLPAGPFREPLTALRRSSLIVVTRKAATRERASEVSRQLGAVAVSVPLAVAHLAPECLRRWSDGTEEPVSALADERVIAVSGIGAPDAFAAQLRAAGATVESLAFGDHHAFTDADVQAIVRRAAGAARVVCTLKDAVKLGDRWNARTPALWYLSQSVVFETGAPAVHAMLDRLAAR